MTSFSTDLALSSLIHVIEDKSITELRQAPTPTNSFQLPRTSTVDLRIEKGFKIRESWKLTLSGDVFNLFNHVNVNGANTQMFSIQSSGAAHGVACSGGAPCLVFQDPAVTGSPSTSLFHAPTASSNTLTFQRQIQVGIKLDF